MAKPFEGFRPPTTKKIHICKPGEPKGVDVPVNRRNYRSLDALLDDLSHRIPRLNYGARRLYTAGGNTEILRLDQLEHQQSYLITDKMGNEKFKSGWEHNRQISRERGTLPPLSRSMTNLNRETTTVSEKSEGRSVSQRSNKSDKAKAFQRAKSLCSPSELGNEPEKKKEVRSKKPPVPKFPRKPKPDTTISPVTAMDTEAKPFESEIIGETNDTDKPITKPKKTKSKLEKKNSKAILIATEIPQELPEETKLPEESENHLEIVEKIPEERVIKSAASIKHNKDEEKEIEKEDVVREPTPKPKTPIVERSPSEMLGEAEEKMESKEIHKVDSIEEISALPQGTAEPEHPPIIDRLNLSDSGNSSSRPTTRQYLHGKIPDETGKEAEKSTIELLDETDLNIIEDDGESIFTSSKTRLSRSGSLSDNNSASRPPPLSSFVKQLEERARKPT